MPKKLPPKQRLFLKEWRIDKNASRAYVRAYKYKGKAANVLGPQLLAKLSKLGLVEAEIVAQEKKAIITADRVLTELADLATMNIKAAFDGAGNLLDIKDMPDNISRSISGIEVDEDLDSDVDESGKVTVTRTRTKKIKFWDKNKSLETIARHLRMLVDRVELREVDEDIDDLTDEELAQIALGKARPGDFKK